MIDPSPRNRLNRDLGPLRIKIQHARGTERTDPNTILLGVLHGAHKNWPPIAGVESELAPKGTGRKAVIYRSHDVRLVLTPDEVARLVLLNLDPDEFFILAEKYGSFFEIHDDFYDWETGVALQPKV